MNLIWDINNAFYKSYSIYKHSYKTEVINEKLLFNKFLIDFFYTCRLFSENNLIDNVICCYDSNESFRKLIYNDYKSNRTKKEKSFYDVLEHSKKYFKEKGFIVSCIDGLEADDCLGIWVYSLKINGINCIISADEDIRQLINEYTFVYNNQSYDKRFYSIDNKNKIALNIVKNFSPKAKYLIENPNWVLFKKMILGCDSDMVPKLLKGRIGEKKLFKFFNTIDFDKNNLNDLILTELSLKIYEYFGEKIFVNKFNQNLSLVNLSNPLFYSDKIIKDIRNHVSSSIFTYKENYQID